MQNSAQIKKLIKLQVSIAKLKQVSLQTKPKKGCQLLFHGSNQHHKSQHAKAHHDDRGLMSLSDRGLSFPSRSLGWWWCSLAIPSSGNWEEEGNELWVCWGDSWGRTRLGCCCCCCCDCCWRMFCWRLDSWDCSCAEVVPVLEEAACDPPVERTNTPSPSAWQRLNPPSCHSPDLSHNFCSQCAAA